MSELQTMGTRLSEYAGYCIHCEEPPKQEPKKIYTSEYPIITFTTDCVVLWGSVTNRQILLIKRKNNPFYDYWALPGGFINANETSLAAAKRELLEETGVELNASTVCTERLTVCDAVNRDPRGRVISIPYLFVLDTPVRPRAVGADDASQAAWWPLDRLPTQLAFDHRDIIIEAMRFGYGD